MRDLLSCLLEKLHLKRELFAVRKPGNIMYSHQNWDDLNDVVTLINSWKIHKRENSFLFIKLVNCFYFKLAETFNVSAFTLDLE